MDLVAEILTSILTSSTVVALVTERLKAKIKAEYDVQLERVKNEHRLSELRFAKIHETSLEKLHLLHVRLFKLLDEMRACSPSELDPQQYASAATSAWNAYHSARDAFVEARLFLDAPACELLESLFTSSSKALEHVGTIMDADEQLILGGGKSSIPAEDFQRMEALVGAIVGEHAPQVLHAIERNFRRALGVGQRSNGDAALVVPPSTPDPEPRKLPPKT